MNTSLQLSQSLIRQAIKKHCVGTQLGKFAVCTHTLIDLYQ